MPRVRMMRSGEGGEGKTDKAEGIKELPSRSFEK